MSGWKSGTQNSGKKIISANGLCGTNTAEKQNIHRLITFNEHLGTRGDRGIEALHSCFFQVIYKKCQIKVV